MDLSGEKSKELVKTISKIKVDLSAAKKQIKSFPINSCEVLFSVKMVNRIKLSIETLYKDFGNLSDCINSIDNKHPFERRFENKEGNGFIGVQLIYLIFIKSANTIEDFINMIESRIISENISNPQILDLESLNRNVQQIIIELGETIEIINEI